MYVPLPQSDQPATSQPYKLAVEVPAPIQDLSHLDPSDVTLRHIMLPTNADDDLVAKQITTDLSHLDPRDPMLRIGRVTAIIPVTPATDVPHTMDITTLFTDEQMASYVRRLKVRKIRLFACAARENKSRAIYSPTDVNSVLVDGNTLTALVRANMDKFKVKEEDIEEMDNTIKSNPKAFWFGTPETPEETQEYIKERVDNAAENLTKDPDITLDNIEELRKLVEKYPKNLRTRLGNDMTAKIPPMRITLREGVESKKIKLYSMKPHARQQMDSSVDELEGAKLIAPNGSSTWCASAQMVPKPGGKPGEMRLVIDYKWINACTVPIQGGMPILGDEFHHIQGSKYFFCADFLKGFWQCDLHEDSQDYLSFMTPKGVYKPLKIPQGAVDSPLYFHNQMALIFKDLISEKKMLLWIDDVLIFAKTWEEYLSLVSRFLELCIKYNLQVNIKKTTLASTTATFCGREISGTGVTYQARNTDTFKNMTAPVEAGDLSQFLMGINWMRESIMNNGATDSFASVSAPLWSMLDKVYTLANSRKKRKYQHMKLSDCGWDESMMQHSNN